MDARELCPKDDIPKIKLIINKLLIFKLNTLQLHPSCQLEMIKNMDDNKSYLGIKFHLLSI